MLIAIENAKETEYDKEIIDYLDLRDVESEPNMMRDYSTMMIFKNFDETIIVKLNFRIYTKPLTYVKGSEMKRDVSGIIVAWDYTRDFFVCTLKLEIITQNAYIVGK